MVRAHRSKRRGQIYLADGVGGFNEQGIDPGLYARVLTYEAAKARAAHAMNPVASPNPKKLIQIAQENAKLPGASTMIIIELFRTQIRAANLGDSGFELSATVKLYLPLHRRNTTSIVRFSLDMNLLTTI